MKREQGKQETSQIEGMLERGNGDEMKKMPGTLRATSSSVPSLFEYVAMSSR